MSDKCAHQTTTHTIDNFLEEIEQDRPCQITHTGFSYIYDLMFQLVYGLCGPVARTVLLREFGRVETFLLQSQIGRIQYVAF